MSPEEKALVKETWQKVLPVADTAARLFYDRLFEIDATTRPLFQTTNLTGSSVESVGNVWLR